MAETVATRQMVLMFTDMVGSTGLKVKYGDEAYARMLALPHNGLFRQLLKRTPGAREIRCIGDGFFAAFESVQDAVNVALLFHHALRSYPWQTDVPQTRIGIHVGQVVTVRIDRAGPDLGG